MEDLTEISQFAQGIPPKRNHLSPSVGLGMTLLHGQINYIIVRYCLQV